MKAIQILMDERLLNAVDREAKRAGSDRSKLIREALTRFLQETRRKTMEDQDRQAYMKRPQTKDEIEPWEAVQAWPEE